MDIFRRLDDRAISFMERYGIRILRYTLGIVFIWFGALKIFGVSPVADLVADTVYWFPRDIVVPALGAVEVVIGLGLITGWAIRLVLLIFFLQMAGTFLTFIIKPGETFIGGNPLKLTVIGEFVLKNVVLLAAGIVVGSTARRADPDKSVPKVLMEKAEDPS